MNELIICILEYLKLTYLAGRISNSNSVIKCLRTIFFDGDMPNADAIVSPENEDSSTTKPPCTPLSAK
jgi:hypothetical protein